MRIKIAFLVATLFLANANPAFAASDYDSSYKQYAKSNNFWFAPCMDDSNWLSINYSPCDSSVLPSNIWYQPATTDTMVDIGFKPESSRCAKDSSGLHTSQVKFSKVTGNGSGKGGIVSPLWSYQISDPDILEAVVSEYWVKTSKNGSSAKWIPATKALKIFPLSQQNPCLANQYNDKSPQLFGWPIPKTTGKYKVDISVFSRARWRCSVYDPNVCSWNKSEFIPFFTLNVIVAKDSVKIGKVNCVLPDTTRSCQVAYED